MNRTVLRRGYVLTMDPLLDDLPEADVLVENDKITEIAPTISVTDALEIDVSGCVVMPGMVDTHRHTWQTQMRAICADWTLTDYLLGMRLTISPAYHAEDVYVGNYTGALEALNAGVTTILDFSHCNNTPEHADAAIQGLVDAGVRALHCYGFFASSPASTAFPDHESRIADFGRVLARHGGTSGLITLGVALTEVGMVPWASTAAEIAAARARGSPMVAHTGCVWGSVITKGIREMAAHRLLGSDQVHVHCNALDEDEWRLLAAAGSKVSVSPETELNMGMGRLAIGKCLELGIHPTLSCDIISLNSGDLLTQARLALAYQRFVDNDRINQSGAMPTSLSVGARDALTWATLYGAEACGLEAVVGSLRPGKQADIVVIGRRSFALRPQHDAAGAIVFQTGPSDVEHVLVAGKLVKRDGVLVGVNVGDVLARAERSASEVLERVHQTTPELPPKPGEAVDFEAFARAHLAEAMQTAPRAR